jgi:hypothetical protein
MEQLQQLIDKALNQVIKDKDNDKLEIVYTPESLIELLTDIKKEIANISQM